MAGFRRHLVFRQALDCRHRGVDSGREQSARKGRPPLERCVVLDRESYGCGRLEYQKRGLTPGAAPHRDDDRLARVCQQLQHHRVAIEEVVGAVDEDVGVERGRIVSLAGARSYDAAAEECGHPHEGPLRRGGEGVEGHVDADGRHRAVKPLTERPVVEDTHGRLTELHIRDGVDGESVLRDAPNYIQPPPLTPLAQRHGPQPRSVTHPPHSSPEQCLVVSNAPNAFARQSVLEPLKPWRIPLANFSHTKPHM
mmetsp:Transcript_37911/g.108273  ORF Transcript_37911/g.108273 Transcript_37911/m.108273 type:complete len:253 (+) Transcript_37911:708-1466(+)